MRYEVCVLFPDGGEDRFEFASYDSALAEYEYRLQVGKGEVQLNDLSTGETLLSC